MSADKDSTNSDTLSTGTDVDTPISCIWCNKQSCRRLGHTFNSYWQLVGLYFGVLFYVLIGALLFTAIERPNEIRNIEESQIARNNSINNFIEFLTNSTNLTEEQATNFTERFLELGRLAAEAERNLSVAENPIWDYASALFFVSTVITTIGMELCTEKR